MDYSIEYLDLEVSNKLFDFSNYYLNEMCPPFTFVDNSASLESTNAELWSIISRGLPENLSYIPTLSATLGLAILTGALSLILFSITKNGKITGTILYSILKSIFLLFMGFFSLLLQIFSLLLSITSLFWITIKINLIEKFLLRWVSFDIYKLQSNKEQLVSNLVYILEKVQEIN